MKKDRYDFVCQAAEGGRDAFVKHPDSGEEGLVDSCYSAKGHILVRTSSGENRCWDYRECEELVRSKNRWPSLT